MNELTMLGKKYGTDKAGPAHNYTEFVYYDMLKNIRDKNIRLLELGVGDTGASVKMWREFFPNADITLFDPFFIIHPDVIVTPEELRDLNINVVIGNQLCKNDLKKLIKSEKEQFHIIIDDASHLSDGMQNSLAVLFPYLKKGGYYVVEDLMCARDRDNRLHEVNAWLDSENVDQKTLHKVYHKKEIHLLDSLDEYDKSGKWKSSLLLEEEKEYLEKNIKTFKVFKDYNNTDNLVVIKK